MNPQEPIEATVVVEPPAFKKSFLEQVLSPQSLQRMMMAGGGILVLGFVVWLWSIGVFENPIVVASLLSGTTLGVLGVGISLVRFSRYQQAGTGLTLLASLAMPLNLWFYDAQGLITLADGGHLWIPAAVCCAIYAWVAHILRKSVFVYALVGGVVMTGMLFLADQSIGRLWELLPPATFLIIVGWLCIHAERLFVDGEGDFSREKFGKAFSRSGLAVLTGGLGMLLGGQFLAAYGDFWGFTALPVIATSRFLKVWALGLVTASAIGCANEYWLRKTRVLAVATLALIAWSALCVLDVLQFQLTVAHLSIVAAIAITIENMIGKREDNEDGVGMLTVILFALAIGQFLGTHLLSELVPGFVISSWLVTLQLVSAAGACVSCWYRSRESEETPTQELGHFMLDLAAVLVAFAALSVAMAFSISRLDIIAAITLVSPVAMIVLAVVRRKSRTRYICQRAAAVSTTTALMCFALCTITGLATTGVASLSWSWILIVSSVIYFVASAGRPNSPTRLAGYLAGIGGISQVLTTTGLQTEYSLVLSATVGGALLAVYNAFIREPAEAVGVEAVETVVGEFVLGSDGPKASHFERPVHVLVIAGSVVGVLLAFSRALVQEADFGLLVMLAFQLGSIAVAGLLTKQQEWRLAFRATAFATAIGAIAVVNGLIDTSIIHRVELASLLGGITLLAIGHVAWYREGNKRDDAATVGLWGGSVLTAVPLALGLLAYRSFEVPTSENGWMLFHEIATIAAALGLTAWGYSCRIRSTTLAGVALLGTYVLSLALILRWPSQLQSVSVVMMIGGGAFFMTAVLLSVYRDRLIGIHADMREKRGVFRVLRWR